MKKTFYFYFLLLPVCPVLLSACFFRPVSKSKNITYSNQTKLKLDVFAPRKKEELKPVLVFIHGGSWRSGKKTIYTFFGKGLARKKVVGVIINYRLSPLTNNEGMVMDAATAVKWVKQNISFYGGDTARIFISGHSAGGQMAALMATNNYFFDSLKIVNPIKGTVLIDAFGLDMVTYFERYKHPGYLSFFSDNPAAWKKASPKFYLHEGMPPFIMYLGGRTYPEIARQNTEFFNELKKIQPNTQLIMNKRKRHETMIFQFYKMHNKNYKTIIEFMKQKQ